mmetsp:Transcript_24720/g.51323  ORF Transcript_24720/g.51323 Transcript_24720/m.51323 type:complete len:128 (+) Transcript_24720:568-951(+)
MCSDKDHHGHCVATILMTDGKEGVMLCQKTRTKWFRPNSNVTICNATAAGDSFLGGFIAWALYENFYSQSLPNNNGKGISDIFNPESHELLDTAVEFGIQCAEATIGYEGTISADILKPLIKDATED